LRAVCVVVSLNLYRVFIPSICCPARPFCLALHPLDAFS
jgi:hypothetical protein